MNVLKFTFEILNKNISSELLRYILQLATCLKVTEHFRLSLRRNYI